MKSRKSSSSDGNQYQLPPMMTFIPAFSAISRSLSGFLAISAVETSTIVCPPAALKDSSSFTVIPTSLKHRLSSYSNTTECRSRSISFRFSFVTFSSVMTRSGCALL